LGLNGQRRGGNRRLRRRLTRAPEAMVGCPVARPRPGSAALPRAVRCALRRHRSRAGAPPRGHFDHAVGQVSAFLKLCKTPPCQTFTPPGTLLSRRRSGPGSVGAAGLASSAEYAPPTTSGTTPRVFQYEMAPRTFSRVRIIFAFSSLSNSILAACAESASPISAPRAVAPQASMTTACQTIMFGLFPSSLSGLVLCGGS
jgi:hypothetical protein